SDNFDVLAGGKQVQVTGSHFVDGMAVTINGKLCTIVQINSNSILCLVPSSTVKGKVNVTVTKPGQAAITLGNGVAYNGRPIADTPAPVASTENTTVNITLTGSDPDNDPITFQIVTQPAKGVLTVVNASTGMFTYTPNLNQNDLGNPPGPDTFTFVT